MHATNKRMLKYMKWKPINVKKKNREIHNYSWKFQHSSDSNWQKKKVRKKKLAYRIIEQTLIWIDLIDFTEHCTQKEWKKHIPYK